MYSYVVFVLPLQVGTHALIVEVDNGVRAVYQG